MGRPEAQHHPQTQDLLTMLSLCTRAGVVRVDQYLSYCSTVKQRYKKWWRRLVDWVVDVTLSNARILFNSKERGGGRPYSLRQFMKKACKEMVEAFRADDLRAAERRAQRVTARAVARHGFAKQTVPVSNGQFKNALRVQCRACLQPHVRALLGETVPARGRTGHTYFMCDLSEPGGLPLHQACFHLIHEPTARSEALRAAAVRSNRTLWNKWRTRVTTSSSMSRALAQGRKAAVEAERRLRAERKAAAIRRTSSARLQQRRRQQHHPHLSATWLAGRVPSRYTLQGGGSTGTGALMHKMEGQGRDAHVTPMTPKV